MARAEVLASEGSRAVALILWSVLGKPTLGKGSKACLHCVLNLTESWSKCETVMSPTAGLSESVSSTAVYSNPRLQLSRSQSLYL